MLFLRLVPTVIEMIVLVWLFATLYGSPWASFCLFISFVVYFIATCGRARLPARGLLTLLLRRSYILTSWRTKLHAKANLAGDDAAAAATDSLTGFEVQQRRWCGLAPALERAVCVGRQSVHGRGL